jgi:acid phosphatase (class A)
MKQIALAILAASLPVVLAAQQAPATNAMPGTTSVPATPRPPRVAYYIDPTILDATILIPAPPAVDSPANQADLAEVHRVEEARTPAQADAAKADDEEEDIFVYKNVFGPGFNAQALPITAALNAHIKNEQSVVGNQVKKTFQRPRPYQIDPSLHPVCKVETNRDSYPSGHGLTGYLSAFTLAEIAPERKEEILARADEYAHNRVVCGVHYQSDVEASRRISYVVFGYMMATPRFQKELEQVREEMRKAGLITTK